MGAPIGRPSWSCRSFRGLAVEMLRGRFGGGLGRMHGLVGMLRRSIQCIQLERFAASVLHIMLSASRDYDGRIILNLRLRPVDPDFALPPSTWKNWSACW